MEVRNNKNEIDKETDVCLQLEESTVQTGVKEASRATMLCSTSASAHHAVALHSLFLRNCIDAWSPLGSLHGSSLNPITIKPPLRPATTTGQGCL